MNSKHIHIVLFLSAAVACGIHLYHAGCRAPEKNVLWSSKEGLQLIALPGSAARPYAEQVIELDLKTYKEWPYLYEGPMEDGLAYFETYFQSKESLFLLLMAGEDVAGYAALIPLQEEIDKIKEPITQVGLRCEEYMYLGSVVIEKEHRHKGIMRTLFKHAEAYAQKCGKKGILLATIEREARSPHRPADDRPLSGLWEHLNFERIQGAACSMRWSNSITHEIESVTIGYWSKKIGEPT